MIIFIPSSPKIRQMKLKKFLNFAQDSLHTFLHDGKLKPRTLTSLHLSLFENTSRFSDIQSVKKNILNSIGNHKIKASLQTKRNI